VKRYLVLLAAFVLFAVACGSLPNIPWPPIPTPPPTTTTLPQPSPSPCVCPLPGGGTYPCADPYCRCGAGACPVPTPSPTATPTPQPTAPPTPAPTPSPCLPSTTVEKVCVSVDGSTFPYTPNACWDCTSWTGYMVRNGYFTAGDPKEDGDAAGRPGFWLNYDPQQVLVGLIRKSDCAKAAPSGIVFADASGKPLVAIDPPYVEKRTVTVPCPNPSPSPSASPTPGPGGCPAVAQVGGMFLSAVDCGQACRRQGYLGVRVNYTATERCREGEPGCVCDPGRNFCEMPRQCQNPNGADIFITLQGKFTNDECDRNSDNFFNCHTKAKADEAGVTLFTSTPWQEPKNPWDPRGVTNCVDIQEFGTKQLNRDDARCKAALKAAGR
jgi:hypothetical protein